MNKNIEHVILSTLHITRWKTSQQDLLDKFHKQRVLFSMECIKLEVKGEICQQILPIKSVALAFINIVY